MRSRLPAGPRLPSLVQGIGFWTRPLATFERWRARYGRRFTMRLPGTPPLVIHSDPAAIKEIFTAPPDVLHPGAGARVLEPVVGSNSLILLDGNAHLEQRKLMLPAFHGERMARLEGLMRDVAAAELERWPRAGRLALHPRMQELTLEIILRAVFGLGAGARLDRLRRLLRTLLEFGERPISMVPPSPGSVAERILSHVGPFKAFVAVQEEADEQIAALVRERREGGAGDDVLSMLLEARHEDGSPMSAEELRDELMTLLVAGHETTASSLAWTLRRLPHHPDAVERIRESDDDDYLVATLQEGLRRRPVLPNCAPRLVVQPIEVGGWSYEPGVCLVPNAYLVHHDPAIYPDPYAFRPERFLDEQPGTYTWIPFGGGRRRCLGSSFAMLEMKVVLGAVLRSFDVLPGDAGMELAKRRNITIRPAGGAAVDVRRRGGERVAHAAPSLVASGD